MCCGGFQVPKVGIRFCGGCWASCGWGKRVFFLDSTNDQMQVVKNFYSLGLVNLTLVSL